MNNNNFFDVNNDPMLCLNKMEPSYENKKWSSCENSKNETCCSFYKDNKYNEDLFDAAMCCDGNNNCTQFASTDARRNAITKKGCNDALGIWNPNQKCCNGNNNCSYSASDSKRRKATTKKACNDANGIWNPSPNKIKSLDEFHNFLNNSDETGIINQYVMKSNEFLNKLKSKNNIDSTVDSEKLKELTKLSIKLDENHRLLTKQYNELIFSPNEVINVDENINKFRYLELDRKLEKYDKKTYSLYKIFFYIMLITSGTLFIRKQIKK